VAKRTEVHLMRNNSLTGVQHPMKVLDPPFLSIIDSPLLSDTFVFTSYLRPWG